MQKAFELSNIKFSGNLDDFEERIKEVQTKEGNYSCTQAEGSH